jgi:hypothetical protein
MTDPKSDPELQAISTLLTVLEPLDANARSNVLGYVFRRLGIAGPAAPAGADPDVPALVTTPDEIAKNERAPHQLARDIRSLTEHKQPKSASEMAALVAYYLAHLAPVSDRREHITASDITKYFGQANFPLPQSSPMTLVHAKNAGYLDQQARGRYRLNPVGHNLIAHRLPATGVDAGARKRGKTARGKK